VTTHPSEGPEPGPTGPPRPAPDPGAPDPGASGPGTPDPGPGNAGAPVFAIPDPHPVRAFLEPAHIELARRVAAFAAGTLAPLPEPGSDAEARHEARSLLQLLGRDGWFRSIGEEDFRGCALVREALGASSPLADAVFALQALAGTPFLLAENEEERARWLPELLAGRAMGAFVMTEPGAGSDVAALATRAVRVEDEYVLDGRKTFISNAGIADVHVVFASTDPEAGTRGITAFVIPAGTPGLRFLGAQVMAAPHPLGELALEGCRIPASHRLGAEGSGFRLGMAVLDRLRPTVGAAATGMAARALHEALHHALRREQFGGPLAELQLIQDKLGRMATELDAGRLLVYRALWEKDRGADRITTEAAMAKAYATEAAQRIVDEAVQILGGRGVLAHHPVDRLYRSVRALRIYEGTTEVQRLIVAGQLIRGARSGAGRREPEMQGRTQPARGETPAPEGGE
jgi:acyl-CoA dehydrogenase